MEADHVRVHAFDVDQVATDLAGHIAGRVGNRLLDQWFSSSLAAMSAMPALVANLLTLLRSRP